MPVVSNVSVEKNEGSGKMINQLLNFYVNREMEKREIKGFGSVLVELFADSRQPKIYFNNEIKFNISFNNNKLRPEDEGRQIEVRLEEVKNITWNDRELDKNSAKFYIIRWNKDFWVFGFDFKYNKGLVEKKLNALENFY